MIQSLISLGIAENCFLQMHSSKIRYTHHDFMLFFESYSSAVVLQNQDSWTGGSGEGDSKPQLDIFTGVQIPCQHSCLECAGFHACPHIDPKLLDVKHYELDPDSLDQIVEAQIQSCITEADSAVQLVLMYSPLF